jgi:hypothetical protein
MDEQTTRFIEILNRLRRGTLEGRVLWREAADLPAAFVAPLDDGYRATVARATNGTAVVVSLTNPAGVQTVHLDSSRAAHEHLRLALLQLYTSVRDTRAKQIADEALDAVRRL